MSRVLVPIANGSEELEAVTLIDLLRRAGIQVTVASLDGEPVTASRGVRLIPDVSLDAALEHEYDLVVLPGGMPGADHLRDDARVVDLLRRMNESGRFVGAICAAPKVLHAAGVLEGRRATAFPGVLEAAGHDAITGEPVTRDAHVLTSRGPGTAMDFALELIETLEGRAKRDEVESKLQRP
ncbi:MAG: DJ-1/PfpI family protein [Xanthomonadales bacterium]|nr:DJ-1/PfpI family protein [Xanthomonadales bacterium]